MRIISQDGTLDVPYENGSLAIGAGIMAAGFVGGKPRPADTQAMEEAQDDNIE